MDRIAASGLPSVGFGIGRDRGDGHVATPRDGNVLELGPLRCFEWLWPVWVGLLAVGIAVGCDVVSLRRIAETLARREQFRTRVFHDTEVRTDASGTPALYVRGERSPLDLSLSHHGDVAFAVVAGTCARRPGRRRDDATPRRRSFHGWLVPLTPPI